MNGPNSGAMWYPTSIPSQRHELPAQRLRSARPTQRCQPGLLTWRRAQTPFCPDDRALKAYRHSQNPRKPAPPPTPLLRRPGTAAPMMDPRRELQGGHAGVVIDSDIINWVRSASVNEKQLAYKLMRCLALASADDAAMPADEDPNLPAASGAPPQILSIDRQPSQLPRPFTPVRDPRFAAERQRQQMNNNSWGGQLLAAGDSRTDPQALFGTMGDREFRRAKREQLARQQAANGDYVYPGAGFLNARPAQRPTFSVHPEWVSERYARLHTQQDGRF